MARDPQKWSPFRELDRVRHDFEELLDHSLGSHAARQHHEHHGPATPALESFIDKGKLVIRAELPGVDPKDVDVTVTGDQLTIRGTRERSVDEQSCSFIHREFSYGSFERIVRLPGGINAEDVKASYNNGVLELTMSVPEQSKSRKVAVQVEGEPSKR
jgi:HSP20 family protein